MARLGDYIEQIRGVSYKPEDVCTSQDEDAVAILRANNIQDDGLIFDDLIYVKKSKVANKQYIQRGDIIVCASSGSKSLVGKAAVANENMPISFGAFCKVIRPKKLLPSYIGHYFQSPKYRNTISEMAGGANINNIRNEHIDELDIAIVSEDEQEKIITELDATSNLISLRKQQLSKLDELVKSRFIELFGDTGKQVPLTDYVWFQEGPGVRSVDFTDDGIILLTGSNINDNTISFGHKSDRHISNELASGKYAHFMCDKDDILVVSSAIDPDKFDKKVVVVDVDKKYCLNTGIIRFKPNKQYLTLGYFREFLKTDYFKHQVSSEMRGIAQMHFGPSHLKQMTILLPDSIERQIEFATFVEQVDKSKFEIQKSLEKLETLKKALMQKYFG